MIPKRIAALRGQIKERSIDAYVIPSGDFHQSEYVGEFFQARKYLSGFTGSAGTLVVTPDTAGLWTDGRYFIQAERQLQGSGITLFRMGDEGVPKLEDWLADTLPENGKLGFDGRVVGRKWAKELEAKLKAKNISFASGEDLAGNIWPDRPAMSCKPVWRLEDKYSGKSTAAKLEELRAALAKENADVLLLASLDDIAWLCNIRGDDVANCPVALSYVAVTADEAILFIQDAAVNGEVNGQLAADGVTVRSYDAVFAYAAALTGGKKVWLDAARVSYAIANALPEDANILEKDNPTWLPKAIKNPVEVENLLECHIKDGVAFTKFMYWVKNRVGKEKITELSAADYLAKRRLEQPGCLDLSFVSIAGYKEHAAMMHYSATPETDYELAPEGMLLVDSGGQYYEGTTDMTRTMILGPVTEEQKLHFTTVVRSMLGLASARFLSGMRGVALDVLSRGPIWDLDLDYKCGTGHGVGYLLNVHEGPNSFHWDAGRSIGVPFEEGMVTTDEPGIYIEGSHGCRTENELLCCKGAKNEYGQFLYFRHMTMAPIDLDGILPELMTSREIDALNRYHAEVYEKLSPYMTPEENEWLQTYTRPVSR